MDASKEQEILTMFAQGLNAVAIASELELSINTVKSVLKAHGKVTVVKTSATRVITDTEQEIGTRYADGDPIPEILAEYDITYTKLYAILKILDVPLRKVESAPAKTAYLEQAIKLYEAGTPLWKIKLETGVAQPTLHAALHERNIPLRRPRQ